MLHNLFLKASCGTKLCRSMQERHAAVDDYKPVFRVSLAPFSHAVYCSFHAEGGRCSSEILVYI